MKLSIGLTIIISSIGGVIAASSPRDASSAASFVARGGPHVVARRRIIPTTTAIHLEDRIAKMIDGEMDRLKNKHEYESERIANQVRWSRVMEPTLPPNFDFEEDVYRLPPSSSSSSSFAVVEGHVVAGFTSGVDRSASSSSSSSPRRRKDERMARNDPMRYCADRCVTTGNCDVFEDMFEMGPSEVIKFCTECVLSDDEEPCDVPQSMFGSNDDAGLRP